MFPLAINNEFGVPMNAAQYAENWIVDSHALADQHAYEWLTTRLGRTQLVLEIGPGTGRGTIELVNSGARVLGIEVNEHLAQSAIELLKEHQVSGSIHSSCIRFIENTSGRGLARPRRPYGIDDRGRPRRLDDHDAVAGERGIATDTGNAVAFAAALWNVLVLPTSW